MKKFLLLLILFSTPLLKAYPPFEKGVTFDRNAIHFFPTSAWPGAYFDTAFTSLIDKKEISSVLEVGSRDALDAFNLSELYECHVFAFECNPVCVEICKHNATLTKNVTVVDKAAWDENGTISFFPVISAPGKQTDPGSSSCFPLNETKLQSYAQDKITVPAIRLDHWMHANDIQKFDLICMDTQGATLKILKGMGEKLKQTKYIITECEVVPSYEGECLLPELVSYLEQYGFEKIETPKQSDFLFINRTLIPRKQ